MDLAALHKNVSELDAIDLAIEVFESLEKFIADLNREQMAVKGQRNDGSQMTPEYSFLTEYLKNGKGGTSGITTHVTLYDTGELHKSIFTNISETIILDSNDSKVSELTDKYGEFLGLTPESIIKLREKFLPLFWERFYGKILE